MDYRHLGRTGVQVSVVGLGCNRIGRTVNEEGTKAIIHCALDEGINFLDTADVYGSRPGASEELLGQALAGLWDRVVLATKVVGQVGEGPNDRGASRYHMMRGVETSLRRLGTDHIDLYYIHFWDSLTPIEETMRALEDLVRAGKVRYLGASNFAAWQLARSNDLAEMMGWNSFVVVQSYYHMLKRDVEHELLPYCRYSHTGMIPYFPLAGGLLTGKYQRGQTPSSSRAAYVQPYMTETNLQILDKLRAFAETRNHTPGELAIAWLLGEPAICSVISGATNAEQVSENAKASAWHLTHEEMTEVRGILEGKT
ncbi:MAG: aldo/keto reductase [Anaerolineae bacterium]